jgi:hypothetical protein
LWHAGPSCRRVRPGRVAIFMTGAGAVPVPPSGRGSERAV